MAAGSGRRLRTRRWRWRRETAVQGTRPKHFDGPDSATTKNGKHLRREYDKVTSEASERRQAIAGPATGDDGHVTTTYSIGQTQEEEGDENPKRASATQEPDGGDPEKRGPLESSRAPNASGRQGGEG